MANSTIEIRIDAELRAELTRLRAELDAVKAERDAARQMSAAWKAIAKEINSDGNSYMCHPEFRLERRTSRAIRRHERADK